MDGVVIYVARDYSRAIIWCNDQGALAVAPRDSLPVSPLPPLACGDFVTFDLIRDDNLRLCGRVTVVPGRTTAGLTDLLRSTASIPRSARPRWPMGHPRRPAMGFTLVAASG